MAKQVCNGAALACSFGASPATLIVLPTHKVNTSSMPAATIMDYMPMKNIPTFGMCSAPTNPAVISATSAALGVFTPAPCAPAITAPWSPGVSDVNIENNTTLDDGSTCKCQWAGVVSVSMAGQEKTNVS